MGTAMRDLRIVLWIMLAIFAAFMGYIACTDEGNTGDAGADADVATDSEMDVVEDGSPDANTDADATPDAELAADASSDSDTVTDAEAAADTE